jgi:predicted RNA binding protein YcfA (HicA-like mRNA interferase family)
MKLPRDLSGSELISKLKKLGYQETRQTDGHVRLTRDTKEGKQHLTIPLHSPLRVGTLSNILIEVSIQLNVSKDKLLNKLK